MKSYLTCLFVFLVSFSVMYSQDSTIVIEEGSEYFEEYEEYIPVRLNFFEGSFSTFIPTGRFAQKVDQSTYFGFSLGYLRQIQKEKPAFIGVEFYHSFMGSLTRNYDYAVNGEFVDVTGQMSANVTGLNLIGRYYPSLKLGPVEPFIEVHFGGKWLYSYLSETGYFIDETEYSNNDFIKGDLVLAYGGAIGLQVFLDQSLYLSIKGSYQVSNSAAFYTKLEEEDGIFPLLPIDGFETVNTVTNNIKLDIGFTYLY